MITKKVMTHFKAIMKELPGVGIILIPEDQDAPLVTNITQVKDGSMVLQHMAAFLHLLNEKELYDKVLDSFEKKGKDLKIVHNH